MTEMIIGKTMIHVIIDKWIRQAHAMNRLDIVHQCWYLKDFIDGICLERVADHAKKFLESLRETDESKQVREFVLQMGSEVISRAVNQMAATNELSS